MDKAQGKAFIGAFSIVFALGSFFYASNEKFKEEMKQAEPAQVVIPKYEAGPQVAAACAAYLERQ